MAAREVVVKRLDAIEDLGGMTVLCTDKTGTLTQGSVELAGAVDVRGEPDPRVAHLAALNAGLQHGFPNPLDRAIVRSTGPVDASFRLDEIPYDFERRRLSVLVEEPGDPVLITKGAVREVLACCDRALVGGREVPIGDERPAIDALFDGLAGRGFRVLALATRSFPARSLAGAEDERGLVFRGFLTFRDPPKEGALEAIANLAAHGCAVRIVTGDDRIVAMGVAAGAGLGGTVLTGAQAFQLHDTYGFPIDLTLEMAAEQGLSVDEEGFRRLMQQQRERAKADSKARKAGVTATTAYRDILQAGGTTTFTGYTESITESQVIGIVKDGATVPAARVGDHVEVVRS